MQSFPLTQQAFRIGEACEALIEAMFRALAASVGPDMLKGQILSRRLCMTTVVQTSKVQRMNPDIVRITRVEGQPCLLGG